MVKVRDMIEERPILNHKGRRQTADGAELPDPTPVAPPIGYNPQKSMFDHVRDMVRSERLKQEAEAAGFETAEEADDFEVGDDYDPTSPYEHDFDRSQLPFYGVPKQDSDNRGSDGGADPAAAPEAAEEVVSKKPSGSGVKAG